MKFSAQPLLYVGYSFAKVFCIQQIYYPAKDYKGLQLICKLQN